MHSIEIWKTEDKDQSRWTVMIRNRTAQIIYQTAYITLGLLGFVASLGFFEMAFRWDFYILFTNLSNYFCIVVMFKELIQTVKKGTNSYVTAVPLMKFCGIKGGPCRSCRMVCRTFGPVCYRRIYSYGYWQAINALQEKGYYQRHRKPQRYLSQTEPSKKRFSEWSDSS